MASPGPRRAARPPASFRPNFTLALLYLAALFFAFALVLTVPPLVAAFRELPEGPAQGDLELASRIAQDAIRGKLWLAFAAAVIVTALGLRAGLLPGLRRG
jgi:ABC-type sulfate transport system permease component